MTQILARMTLVCTTQMWAWKSSSTLSMACKVQTRAWEVEWQGCQLERKHTQRVVTLSPRYRFGVELLWLSAGTVCGLLARDWASLFLTLAVRYPLTLPVLLDAIGQDR